MFTKKHYEALAKVIHYSRDLNHFIELLIVKLKADNEGFNEKKFRHAIETGV